jgi:hypothetical protein
MLGLVRVGSGDSELVGTSMDAMRSSGQDYTAPLMHVQVALSTFVFDSGFKAKGANMHAFISIPSKDLKVPFNFGIIIYFLFFSLCLSAPEKSSIVHLIYNRGGLEMLLIGEA